MGKAHAFAYAMAPRVFDLPVTLDLHSLADVSEEAAVQAAGAFGFRHGTGDWRKMVAEPDIDIISITTPNAMHHEMALAAIAAGKAVYCEKPLALSVTEAREMTEAAERAGVPTQLGFNYLCNPMISLAKEMIDAGEVGEVRGFRGIHAEDFMADASLPFGFRHEDEGGGALADIGSHILATAQHLMGPITSVLGDCVTVIGERPDGQGKRRAIGVDDVTRAFLVFEGGATGSIEANWLSTGRKMQHDFEIYGSKGALRFSQEHFNELWFYASDDPQGRQGFRRVESAPVHAPYGRFCVAPGHQIGFNDLKSIELAGFIEAILKQGPERFNFRKGLDIQNLMEAIATSSREKRWVELA